MGNKETYAVSELIRDAKDAEDAIKRFKADGNSFVKPVVSILCSTPYTVRCTLYWSGTIPVLTLMLNV